MIRVSRRQMLSAGAFATMLASRPQSARTQSNYPERPIRIIYPYAAGGVGDTILRMIAPRMEQRLGQKLVIEPKPGAAGNIGTQEIARAEPDGYSVLVAATNNFVINQFVMKLSFDPLAALEPVAKVAEIPIVLFSNPAVPAANLAEFVTYARANPGRLNYGSPSSGTVNHLFIERLKQTAGLDMTHVPFRGSPPGVLALLANDIQLFPVGLAAGAGHLREGKLKALAVATTKRVPMLPDVPTVIESGFLGFIAANWWGMAVPKHTPEPAIRVLDAALAEALRDPTVIERFKSLGMLIPSETREQFGAELKSEAELWSQTIRQGKITIE
jgi:tripartite-type tricarboxylate transporter receptor subunit TctC